MSKCRYALSLIACMALAAPAFADSINGTYVGERVLTRGSPVACVPKDPVTVVIQNDTLTITNSRMKNYGLGFSPRPDGSFVQLATDMGGEVVDINGRVAGGVLDADVTGPNCSHHWHLLRKG